MFLLLGGCDEQSVAVEPAFWSCLKSAFKSGAPSIVGVLILWGAGLMFRWLLKPVLFIIPVVVFLNLYYNIYLCFSVPTERFDIAPLVYSLLGFCLSAGLACVVLLHLLLRLLSSFEQSLRLPE